MAQFFVKQGNVCIDGTIRTKKEVFSISEALANENVIKGMIKDNIIERVPDNAVQEKAPVKEKEKKSFFKPKSKKSASAKASSLGSTE